MTCFSRRAISITLRTLFVACLGASFCFGGQSPSAAAIPDSTDIKNEFIVVKTKLDSHMKEEEEHFTESKRDNDRLWQLLVGSVVLIMGALFAGNRFQTDALKKANQLLMENSVKGAQDNIQRLTESAKESILRSEKSAQENIQKITSDMQISVKSTQDSIERVAVGARDNVQKLVDSLADGAAARRQEVDNLETRIIGVVHQTFERPTQIKRESLLEVVRLLLNEGIIDFKSAERMNHYIDQHYGGAYNSAKSGS